MDQLQKLTQISNLIKYDSIRQTKQSKSGHPTSCCSISDVMAVLFFSDVGMNYSINHFDDLKYDRLVLSKGHAAPALFSCFYRNGYFTLNEMMSIRQFSSDLEGHPTRRLPFVDCATGSLGQGLGVACGIAIQNKIDSIDNHTYVILGDGEMAEGNVWESIMFAKYNQLNNLIAFIDVNKLGQSQFTQFQEAQTFKDQLQAFGWETELINGHNIQQILQTLQKLKSSKNQKPKMIILDTIKGKGIKHTENLNDFHGKPILNDEQFDQIIQDLNLGNDLEQQFIKETKQQPIFLQQKKNDFCSNEPIKKDIATRMAYGLSLCQLGKDVVVLDADTKNSTFSIYFLEKYPERFIECFISEQNMVTVAMGLAARGKIPFLSSFGAFLTRSFDQFRIAGISNLNIKVCGSHVGVSIGEDGPTQMALEDISMFRSIQNTTIFYPSDSVSTQQAVYQSSQIIGMCYIRTTRLQNKTLYAENEKFEIGKAKILKKSDQDSLLIISGGYPLHQILQIQETNKPFRLMDLYTIVPIDKNAIIQNAKQCQNQILVIEDHYQRGGIYDEVLNACKEQNFTINQIAITSVPKSGSQKDLYDYYNLSSEKIRDIVNQII